jgi:hypothetical protein
MNDRNDKTNPQEHKYPREDTSRRQHKHQDEFETNSNEEPLEKARSARDKHHYEDSQTDNERMIPDTKQKTTHKQDIIDRKLPNIKK